MRRFTRAGLALSAFALVAFLAAPAFAQQAAQSKQDAAAAPIQGELVKVDTDAKTIVVKPADGNEVEFTYNDKTEVTGAKEGVAGLATMKEGQVTVHFTEDAQTNAKLATRIEIQPPK